MAINSPAYLTDFFLVLLVLSSLPLPSDAVPSEELDWAISVLRSRGRALFANAISTSDILFDLLSAESLTLLGPTDSMLFSLDMTYSLPFYISTLRIHALPLRLPLSDLHSLPNASSVPTLFPTHRLLLTRSSSISSLDSIYLDGVQLLLPGLFYSQHIAVHGLGNILPLRSTGTAEQENHTVALPPTAHTPARLPSIGGLRRKGLPPRAKAYIPFFGGSPAEAPRMGEVSVSPSQWEEDLSIDDEGGRLDLRTNEF